MKATIDIDPVLYRQLKVEAARRGRTIRDLVADGVRSILGAPASPVITSEPAPMPWLGVLRKYAVNAGGKHDLAAMRRSVARGRKNG